MGCIRSLWEMVRRRAFSHSPPGMALAPALVILTVLLIFGLAMLTLAFNETQIAASSRDAVQALHLADAGVELARLELQRRLDTIAGKTDFDAELTTNGGYLFGGPGAYATHIVNGATVGEYRVRITDNTEGATPPDNDDQDKVVWLASDARVITRGHTVRRSVQALVVPTSLGAFVMGCDANTPAEATTLTISGNPTIAGSQGSVHSNCNLTTTGTTSVAQNITAVGDLSLSASTTNGGIRDPDAPPIPLPVVNPADFKSLADYVLRGDGKVFQQTSPGVFIEVHDAATQGDTWPGGSNESWQWTDKSGSQRRWQFSGSQVHPLLLNKAFYFEKAPGTDANNVSVSGSPPSGTGTWQVTIIGEGHIDISGNPDLRAADGKQNLLFIAGTDVKIGGNFTSTFVGGGVIAAHEQISVSGNPTVTGFFLAENAAHSSTLVTNTFVSGNPVITYDGLPPPPANWTLPLRIAAWQEVPSQ